MDTSINTLVSIIILLSCVCLLQIHGIAFWTEKIGIYGWGWSLLLEVSALWLWYRPKFTYRLLAILVSLLTLAGPIHHVTSPIIAASHQVTNEATASHIMLKNLESEKVRLEDQLSTYQSNSEKRTGWLTPITSANERLKEIDKQIASLMINKPNEEKMYVNWVIIMEVAGLVIFQTVAVLAILTLSKLQNTTNKNSNIANQKPAKTNEPIELERTNSTEALTDNEASNTQDLQEEPDPLVVLNNVESFLKQSGKNYREFSEYAGVSTKELSFLRNHKKRLTAGERTVSLRALEQIQKILNI